MARYVWDRFKRRTIVRSPLKVILLLCEGAKTELNYFNGFHEKSNCFYRVNVEKACATQARRIVDEACERKYDGYESVWCVFDKDNDQANPPGEFDQAIEKARRKGIRCAFSNECIELWFVLHFRAIQSALPRHGQGSYGRILDTELQKLGRGKYVKTRTDMYEILLKNQPIAIRNAKMLMANYPPSTKPSSQNPGTTIHELVEMLNNLPR